MWSEEASDSLFALPEASLLPLIIAKWKCRLCFQPGIALSALQLWSCKEILFLHPSKDTQQATRIFLSCITVIYCVCSWMKSSTITVFSMKWTSSQSIQCLLDHFRFQVKWLDFYELILSYLSGLCQDAPRQLCALTEEWKSWQWDSSEKEFPEDNRRIQSMKKHYSMAQACSAEISTKLWTSPGSFPCLGGFLQKAHGQRNRWLRTKLSSIKRLFRSFLITQRSIFAQQSL